MYLLRKFLWERSIIQKIKIIFLFSYVNYFESRVVYSFELNPKKEDYIFYLECSDLDPDFFISPISGKYI